jgi:transposase
MKTEVQIDVQDLDHLGIIAGIVDEIGIVEVIDKEIGTDLRENVSAGQIVKAMIINCMGFITAPLYLFDEFFEGKATEHLIGPGVKAEYLNDSRIGRVLDQITIKMAKDLARDLLPEQLTKSNLYKGYQSCSVCHEYAGIKQLWVIVESDERKSADLKSLSKRISKSLAAKLSSLNRLSNYEFACEADALIAAADFEKTLPYHLLSDLTIVPKPHYQRQGRPRPGVEVSHYTYQIQSTLCQNEIAIENYRNQAGRFILATNLLDEERILIASTTPELYQEEWTNDLILKEYKSQQSTERGFRFIKDPLFFVSRVFLKSTKRIMALAMIMTLALMVYSLGQRQLRRALEQADSTLPNQKGKPTARPTLRWIQRVFSVCSSCLYRWD